MGVSGWMWVWVNGCRCMWLYEWVGISRVFGWNPNLGHTATDKPAENSKIGKLGDRKFQNWKFEL
jgi:hypothetical protein